MTTVFWNFKMVFLIDILPRDQTIYSEVYFKTKDIILLYSSPQRYEQTSISLSMKTSSTHIREAISEFVGLFFPVHVTAQISHLTSIILDL